MNNFQLEKNQKRNPMAEYLLKIQLIVSNTEFKNMDEASAPLPFSLPIAGVKELTLTWTSEGAGGWKDWGRFATVFDGRLLVTAPDQR